jgi:hypothetical protein
VPSPLKKKANDRVAHASADGALTIPRELRPAKAVANSAGNPARGASNDLKHVTQETPLQPILVMAQLSATIGNQLYVCLTGMSHQRGHEQTTRLMQADFKPGTETQTPTPAGGPSSQADPESDEPEALQQ